MKITKIYIAKKKNYETLINIYEEIKKNYEKLS